MPKHAIEVLCVHRKNQNSKPRRRLHRFYDKNKAIEYIDNLNEFSKVLHVWNIGIDKHKNIYYRQETSIDS